LVLEQVGLGGARESTMAINLAIATYFVSEELADDPGAFEPDTPEQKSSAGRRSTEARGERSSPRRSAES
jgi:hypothetical protein